VWGDGVPSLPRPTPAVGCGLTGPRCLPHSGAGGPRPPPPPAYRNRLPDPEGSGRDPQPPSPAGCPSRQGPARLLRLPARPRPDAVPIATPARRAGQGRACAERWMSPPGGRGWRPSPQPGRHESSPQPAPLASGACPAPRGYGGEGNGAAPYPAPRWGGGGHLQEKVCATWRGVSSRPPHLHPGEGEPAVKDSRIVTAGNGLFCSISPSQVNFIHVYNFTPPSTGSCRYRGKPPLPQQI